MDILYVKFAVKIFFSEHIFPKFCDSFNEPHFHAKITIFYYWFYWFWMVLTGGGGGGGDKSGSDLVFAFLCKWRSRISSPWNVKQAKKRLRSVLIQSNNLCIFLRRLWCAKFPWFSREALVLKHVVRGWLPKC